MASGYFHSAAARVMIASRTKAMWRSLLELRAAAIKVRIPARTRKNRPASGSVTTIAISTRKAETRIKILAVFCFTSLAFSRNIQFATKYQSHNKWTFCHGKDRHLHSGCSRITGRAMGYPCQRYNVKNGARMVRRKGSMRQRERNGHIEDLAL